MKKYIQYKTSANLYCEYIFSFSRKFRFKISIYMQIAEWIEIEILRGNFLENEKVYSQYKLAEVFQINPATAAKGLTLLGQEGILYGKRGLGKFVSLNAKKIIKDKRKNETMQELIETLIKEATHLNISEEELIQMIKDVHKKIGGGRN